MFPFFCHVSCYSVFFSFPSFCFDYLFPCGMKPDRVGSGFISSSDDFGKDAGQQVGGRVHGHGGVQGGLSIVRYSKCSVVLLVLV